MWFFLAEKIMLVSINYFKHKLFCSILFLLFFFLHSICSELWLKPFSLGYSKWAIQKLQHAGKPTTWFLCGRGPHHSYGHNLTFWQNWNRCFIELSQNKLNLSGYKKSATIAKPAIQHCGISLISLAVSL